MKSHKILSTWAAGIAALSLLVGAFATQALAQDDEEIEEIIVEGSLRSLPTQDVGSVFGFDKSVLETPRSISTISSEQIERFGIANVDDFVALAPGTFTQSFFGTNGLDVRGTAGETYFRGVRRLDNPGNYPTPIGASDRIDIVRGPASPIYGPSKIGGYLNFVPKSARADNGQYLDVPQGSLSYTTGSWDKSVLTAEVGGPGELGGREFGYYLYGMLEDSVNPDLIVAFAAGIDMDSMDIKTDPESGLEMLANVPLGALSVILVDAVTGRAIWVGVATADVQENPTLETTRKRLDFAVSEMFDKLPH